MLSVFSDQLFSLFVLKSMYLINSDNPVFRCVGFLENVQLEILVSNLSIPDPVIARWAT